MCGLYVVLLIKVAEAVVEVVKVSIVIQAVAWDLLLS